MVRVYEIKANARGFSLEALPHIVEKSLRLPAGSVLSASVVKESVDARKKPEISRVFTLDVESSLPDEAVEDGARRNHYKFGKPESVHYEPAGTWDAGRPRPVIAGFGPCGMLAALVLARAGARPIVLERGASMEQRISAVESYWKGGTLDPNANVQFGEGGAGTFSDGKLTTGTRNPAQSYVLDAFIKAGASSDIAVKQKPHVGTDVIRKVVVNIRKEIESLGGELRFLSKLTGIELASGAEGAAVSAVVVNDCERIETDTCILAVGHSARDTFAMLGNLGLRLEQKAFSIGVRVEHPQSDIDMAQYGALHQELGIGPAEYKLSCRSGDRGVYTFCMCPGGLVVDSSSEEGMLVTNGMSYSARDGEFANSAVLCDVRPADFESEDPLAGVRFQEKYEKLAFEIGKGRLPKGEAAFRALPEFASKAIKDGLIQFGRKLKGFDKPAEIYGIESRSSSPVRIKRDARLQALASDMSSVEGLYPGGEGAGYAGGIMSAAVDGIHLAEAALSSRH